MLIQSQDNKTIVNLEKVVGFHVYNRKIYCLTTNSNEGFECVMGEYSTDEKAQFILSDILIRIKDFNTCKLTEEGVNYYK